MGKTTERPGDLRGHLAALLARWDYPRSPAEVVALGAPALQCLLDSTEGKAIPSPPGVDPRDFEDARQAALAAFGVRDLSGVLSEMGRRGWTDRRIVLSGLARVVDERIATLLLDLYASKDAFDRHQAIESLGRQKDPHAIEALLRALFDRSETVLYAAVEQLGDRGDPETTEALGALAKRSSQKPWIAKAAKAAIAKIRKSLRTTR